MVDYAISYVFYIAIFVIGLKVFKDVIKPRQ